MPRTKSPDPAAGSDIERIAGFAATLNAVSRPVIAEHFRRGPDIEKKTDQTPVTVADRMVETSLREAIAEMFPDHGIIGEEGDETRGTGEFTWIIDPIDGTRAFSCGNPLFGTLVAVLRRNLPVVGMIDLPALDQCWIGVEGGPSELNGQPAATAGTARLGEARIATTSAVTLGDDAPRFGRLAETCRVVNYGGDCANYGHLASGWCDIVAESNLKAYDIMAAIPIVTGAGGRLSQWDGGEIALDTFDGTALAASSAELHARAVEALN